MAGRFLSVDGVDGAGKSTQIERLIQTLEHRGHEVLLVRDPGGTALGEALREILLHRQEIPLDMCAEMLVYMASRAQLVAEVMRPALAAGKVVVSDRYLLANVVYQGSAGGLSPDAIWQIGEIATGGLNPDLTLILDLDAHVALARIARGRDRLESRGVNYMEKVRNGFLEQSKRMSSPCAVIDASQSMDQMHADIIQAIDSQRLFD